jgi:hypothetical protein
MKLTIGKLNIEFNFSLSWEKPYLKQVKQALREGRRLQAVKIYKDGSGLGLKESKDAVDLLLPEYYKDYKPPVTIPEVNTFYFADANTLHFDTNPNLRFDVVNTRYYDKNPIPNVRTWHPQTPKYGMCKSIDLFTMVTKPQPEFVGDYDECLKWKQENTNRMVYTMVRLTDEEVQTFVRNKLSQPNPEDNSFWHSHPNPNDGSETPPENPTPREDISNSNT